ncbi:MAG: hypothetical protein ACK55Z_22225, partial [bacterium]
MSAPEAASDRRYSCVAPGPLHFMTSATIRSASTWRRVASAAWSCACFAWASNQLEHFAMA